MASMDFRFSMGNKVNSMDLIERKDLHGMVQELTEVGSTDSSEFLDKLSKLMEKCYKIGHLDGAAELANNIFNDNEVY